MKYTTAREGEGDRERKGGGGGETESGWIHVESNCPRQKDKALLWKVKDT